MSKDEILQALRLTAMGRAGHPLQEELAEKLAGVFAHKCKPLFSEERVPADVLLARSIEASAAQKTTGASIPVAEFVAAVDEAVAPKRRKKAD